MLKVEHSSLRQVFLATSSEVEPSRKEVQDTTHLHQQLRMSTAAKLTLASTLVATGGIIYLVHRQQQLDQAVGSSCDSQNIL